MIDFPRTAPPPPAERTVVSNMQLRQLPPETAPAPPIGADAPTKVVPDLFGSGDFAPPPTSPAAAPTAPTAPAAGFGGMTDAFAAGMAATSGESMPAPPAPPPGFGTPFVSMDVTQASGPPRSSAHADDPNTLSDDSTLDSQPGLDEGLKASLLGANAPGTSLSDEADHDQGLDTNPGEATSGGAANLDFGPDPFSQTQPSQRPAPPPAELFAARPQPMQPAPKAPEEVPGLADPTRENADKTVVAGAPAKKKKAPARPAAFIETPREPSRAYRLMLALFFAGAFASAFASLTDGSFDYNRIDRGRLSLLIGPPTVPDAMRGLAITARRGGYVTTSPGKPRVYTAQSVVINAGEAPRGFLEVRGRILDAKGGVLAETTVPCGNSFRDDQLLGFRSGDELRRAYLPAGDDLSNSKLAPGAALACTVVFFEAPSPEKTAAFDLEIVAAQPAS